MLNPILKCFRSFLYETAVGLKFVKIPWHSCDYLLLYHYPTTYSFYLEDSIVYLDDTVHYYISCVHLRPLRCREGRAKLFSVVPTDRNRSKRHKLKQRRFHLNIRKHFFLNCEGNWVLEQVTRRGCWVFILGDTQKTSGHDPAQPRLSVALPEWGGWTRWPSEVHSKLNQSVIFF